MNDLEQWQESNARELAAAMAALRQRLERYIEQQQAEKQPPSSIARQPPRLLAASESGSKRSFLQRLTRGQQSVPLALPLEATTRETSPDAETSAPAGTPSALAMLSERLGLSAFEQQVLLLCAGMELDTRIASLCARAHDDPNKPFPTFALALALFDDPSWNTLSPEGPLRYWRLIEINQPGAQPLTSSALRADERIVSYLKGLNYLDDRVSSFFSPFEIDATSAELAPSQRAIVEMILRYWQRAMAIGPLPVVQLLGPDAISKQLVAYHAAAKLNRRLYRLPAETLPTAPNDLETLARFWQREGRLLPLALYLDAEEMNTAATSRFGSLSRFIARNEGFCFVDVREAMPRLERDIAVDVAKPTPGEEQTTWAEELGVSAGDSPARLAAQFSFNLPQLRNLAKLAKAEAQDSPELLSTKVWDVCRASERPRLDLLAQRLEPKANWDDLVLPSGEINLLREIAAQIGQRNKVYEDWGLARKMNRGFGISALFAGDSGCGKTMAAEVIANGLRLNLYRIDLSAVVNKYIGETEKNLRRVFDAAEDGGAVLLFDEADALFGKRSEVKDSHDRYANVEVSYLLQRMEAYRGLAILTTNMKSALDPAFLRRLRFVVNFPFPGVADRLRLWKKVFLQEDAARGMPVPPLGTLDYDRLARLNMSGGSIHNVMVNACFMAAYLDSQVTMPLVLEAARVEFIKLNRPINPAHFRWAEPALSTSAPGPRTVEPALA